MELRDKYSKLINLARDLNVSDLSITENSNVLYISGTATSSAKHQIWDLYKQIDPDMRAGDLILNLEVEETNDKEASHDKEEMYAIQSGDSLGTIAQKYPDMTWQKIYEANKDVIDDPNKIFPGQKIKIPV